MKNQESFGESIDILESDLSEVIKAFIERNEFLHEFRIQKLLYLAELIALSEEEKRLTNSDFKPFMYGMYSEDVSDTLEDLEKELKTKKDIQHGKLTTVFEGREYDADIDEEWESIVDRANEIAQNYRSEDLGQWSKLTLMYSETPFGENVKFEEFIERQPEIEEDIRKLE